MTKYKTAPAAKFLLAIAAIIILILISGILYTSNQMAMLRFAFTPSHQIAEEEPAAAPDYASADAWAARPGMSSPATMLPEGVMQIAQVPEVDVFYIHPTTYLNKERWNSDLAGDEREETWRQNFALRQQASAFNLAGLVYAPLYRQATFGAFLDDSGQGVQAIMRAHADVLAAFDQYIQQDNKGRPFILVGHSQGALHSLMLLAERFAAGEAAAALRERLVAAYLIGWPVSIEGDIRAVPGIEACAGAKDTACVVSFQSFGKVGDATAITDIFKSTPGLNGQLRKGTKMLCTNPLTWTIGGTARADANKGAIPLETSDAPLPEPVPGLTGARCGKDGILYLTRPPQGDWREYLMAGENYHVYDINLFYMNIRENAAARARAWLEAHR
jgi:hypothetical protein